jgi:hypothetical protein
MNTAVPLRDYRKHCFANHSSTGCHTYDDDTGTTKSYGQPTPIKPCSVMGPPYTHQSTQCSTHDSMSEAVQGPAPDQEALILRRDSSVSTICLCTIRVHWLATHFTSLL